jgi:hypothetical protein
MIFDLIQQLARLPDYLGKPHRLSPSIIALLCPEPPWPFNRVTTPRALPLNKKFGRDLLVTQQNLSASYGALQDRDPSQGGPAFAQVIEGEGSNSSPQARFLLKYGVLWGIP